VLSLRSNIMNNEKLKIRINPDSVLRKKAESISPEKIKKKDFQKLIADMKAALLSSKNGVGLAAPQIGVSRSVFIALENAEKQNPEDQGKDIPKGEKILVFINPKIIKRSRNTDMMFEGCLSTPDIYGEIKRARQVTIEALNEKGEKIARGAGGILAEIFQHEIDHLNGILFIDNAINLKKYEPNSPNEIKR